MQFNLAIEKVKNALSSRDYIASLTHYHFINGQVYATNGAMTASCPVDVQGQYVIPAEELDKALNIFGNDATFLWQEDTLTIKKARRRITIRLLKPETVPLIEPVPEKDTWRVPSEFISQIKKIRPFISDDASKPWALTAWLHKVEGSDLVWTATNNISVVEVDAVPSYPKTAHIPETDCQIPNFALDFVIQRGTGLKSIGSTPNKASFFFEDGSQMTTQLFSQKMPDQVSNIVQNCYDEIEDAFFLNDDWRSAYSSIVQLSPEEISLSATTMTAGRRQAEMVVEVCSPVPRDETKKASFWNPKFLTPIVDAVTHIDFGAYPSPSRFKGDGIRGLTVGKLV